MVVALISGCAGLAATHPVQADAASVWEGEARAAGAKLPMTIALQRGDSGWIGTVDVPSQYALGYPLTDLRVDDTTVVFRFPDLLPPGVFEGHRAGGVIRGRFTSPLGSDTMEGTFELWRRPPGTVPYSTQSVLFRNGELELAGTIFRQRASGPLPAVVFVHGSGPQTRPASGLPCSQLGCTVVCSTPLHQPRGGGNEDDTAELHLGPGSYLMQPGGNYRHTTSCDTDADRVFFEESDAHSTSSWWKSRRTKGRTSLLRRPS